MDRFSQAKCRHIEFDGVRNRAGQAFELDLAERMIEDTAHRNSLGGSHHVNRNGNGNSLLGIDFEKIRMHQEAIYRIALEFLHENRLPGYRGVPLQPDQRVHSGIAGLQDRLQRLGVETQAESGLPMPIDHGGHTPSTTNLPGHTLAGSIAQFHCEYVLAHSTFSRPQPLLSSGPTWALDEERTHALLVINATNCLRQQTGRGNNLNRRRLLSFLGQRNRIRDDQFPDRRLRYSFQRWT